MYYLTIIERRTKNYFYKLFKQLIKFFYSFIISTKFQKRT